MRTKQEPMQNRMAALIANDLREEIDNEHGCAEESWGGYLNGGDAIVQSVSMQDGLMTFEIEKDNKRYELKLQPVSWTRKRGGGK